MLEEGDGPFEVVSRDQIRVRFTARTADGKIFDGSYDNIGPSDQPERFQNLKPTPIIVQTRFGTRTVRPLVEGLRKGLLGMKEGEKRTIVVPPDMGYTNGRYGTNGFDLRGKTLTYDVELIEILD